MVEAKVDEEVNKRLKHEFENKEWIEHKIGRFKDEIVNITDRIISYRLLEER